MTIEDNKNRKTYHDHNSMKQISVKGPWNVKVVRYMQH